MLQPPISAAAVTLLRPFEGVVRRLHMGVLLVMWLLAMAWSGAVRADPVELPSFDLTRNEEGLVLDFTVQFGLSRTVEDALLKGVPLFFVAEADVFRDRWYWRDKQVNTVTRTWRLAYQPLTRKYRVTLGGLNQNYDSLTDALAVISRTVHWKLAEASQLDDGHHYVEFRYQLDTTQMPRPMQIGITGQPEWSLRVERVRKLP